MNEIAAIPATIRGRIIARGIQDSDSEAWLVARRIGALLKEKYGAEYVLVFGSLAKKTWTRYSDIDLAVKGIPVKLFSKHLRKRSCFPIVGA